MPVTDWMIVVTGITGLASGLLGVGVAWGIVRTRLRGHGARIVALESIQTGHLKDVNPHVTCAIHGTELKTLTGEVVKLNEHHNKLDERIYNMLVNGGPKRHASGGGQKET